MTDLSVSPTPPSPVDVDAAAAAPEESNRLETWTAIVLGVAAVLTAVAAYFSAAQGGDEAEARATSIAANSEANSLVNSAIAIESADQAMFAKWAETSHENNEELTTYLLDLMRPELKDAILAWGDDASGAQSPLQLDSYVIAEDAQAEAAYDVRDKADAKAATAADKGDTYDKATVFLALSLFFAGIATTFRRRRLSTLLLGVAVVALVIGGAQLATA